MSQYMFRNANNIAEGMSHKRLVSQTLVHETNPPFYIDYNTFDLSPANRL